LIDRDQGRHLSRVFDFKSPVIAGLVLGEDPRPACASSIRTRG
jgi:hypothetical protein